jgi:N12 class adenine-specific DNA methylase
MSRRQRSHDLYQLSLFDLADVPVAVSAKTAVAAAVIAAIDFDGFGFSTGDIASLNFARNFDAVIEQRKLLDKPGQLTHIEKLQLASFSGWGRHGKRINESGHFVSGAGAWSSHHDLLGADTLESARVATLDSYFTPPEIIDAVWQSVRKFGFKGGNVLEPSAGSGRFIGLCPADLRSVSRFVAVEKDSFSARILDRLYGDTETIIHSGFEDARLPDAYFDLVVGNVPFGTQTLTDRQASGTRAIIHDFFILKSLRKLRPEGIAVIITTSRSLDKSSKVAREKMLELAQLVCAARLPREVFTEDNASVTTDILVFQKRRAGESASLQSDAWLHTKPFSDDVHVNSYFLGNPAQVLGNLNVVSNRFGEDAIVCDGPIPSGQLIASTLTSKEISCETNYTVVAAPLLANNAMHEGSFQLIESQLRVVRDGLLVLLDEPVNSSKTRRIKSLLAVRDQARKLLKIQSGMTEEIEISAERIVLNEYYDAHVANFKVINDRLNRQAMDDDPSFPLLLSLEVWSEADDCFVKAPVFSRRTTWPYTAPTSADCLKDAITLSRSQVGKIDIDYMAKLLSQDSQRVRKALADEAGVFRLTDGESFVASDEYLSGNLAEKLEAAESASALDERYERNVLALKSALPTPIPAIDIIVSLGQAWIPSNVYEQWVMHETGGLSVRLIYSRGTATWRVDERDQRAQTTLGTSRLSFFELLLCGLNQSQPKVFDRRHDGTQVLNSGDTLAAQARLGEMQESFSDWIWTEEARIKTLATLYNSKFNVVVPRKYDGSHLSFPGMSQLYVPRSTQRNAVWRGLSMLPTLFDHFVGAGKTLILVSLAMELRRLGLARKPLIVVANRTLPAFTAEFLRIYPGANVLMMGSEDMQKSERKRFVAKVATGDWDAIVMAQSVFDRLGIADDSIDSYADEMANAILLDSSAMGCNTKERRKLLQQAQQVRNKIKALQNASNKDDHILFEELGIDYLLVDEAHAYKNLFVMSKMSGVAGVATSASQRAINMLLKVRHIHKVRSSTTGVVFATATPLTNTMCEVFVLQKYLRPDTLEHFGLEHFDAWAAHFGRTVSDVEISPDGSGFRLKERFAQFQNVPELARICSEFWDTVFPEDVEGLVRPEMEEGRPIVVSTEPSAVQRAFISGLVERARDIKLRVVKPTEDNMLKLVSDGAKCALDMRLLDTAEEDSTKSKLNACVRNVFEIWSRTTDAKSTQIVFCDLGVSGKQGFSVYDDIRRKLLDRGVPESQLAFAQDFSTDSKLAELDRKMNAGVIRILLGSTEVLGIGRNVQKRLYAWHHLDVPYRADQVEQRDGRGIRHGNTNRTVRNYRYVTEGSFDAYKWQTVERKARFTSQFRRNGSTQRVMEDLDSNVLSYAEVKALASGNPSVREMILLQNKAQVLKAKISDRSRMLNQLKSEIKFAPEQISSLKNEIADYAHALPMRIYPEAANFSFGLNEHSGLTLDEFAKQLQLLAREMQDRPSFAERDVGHFGGGTLTARRAGEGFSVRFGACSTWTHIRAAHMVVNSLAEAMREMDGRAKSLLRRLQEIETRLPVSITLLGEMTRDSTALDEYQIVCDRLAVLEKENSSLVVA